MERRSTLLSSAQDAFNRQPLAFLGAISILAMLRGVGETIDFISFQLPALIDQLTVFVQQVSDAVWGWVFSYIEFEPPTLLTLYLTAGLTTFGMNFRARDATYGEFRRINSPLAIAWINPLNLKYFFFNLNSRWRFFLYSPFSLIANLAIWPLLFVIKLRAYLTSGEREAIRAFHAHAFNKEMDEDMLQVLTKIARTANRIFLESLGWAILLVLLGFAASRW